MRRLAATALLAALLLAGCSSPRDGAPAPTATGTETLSDTASPTVAPQMTPDPAGGRLDASVLAEARTNFNLTGCLNPRMLFILDPEAAQALLPPGFKAADATGLVQFTGAPFGSPVPAGKAVGGYDFLSCAGNTLDGGPAAFSQVGILVQPPDLGERTPLENATYDLYLLALHVDRPAWRTLALESGFTDAQAPLADIVSEAGDHGAGRLGSGSVAVGAALGSADYALPATGRELNLQARYWHVGANGTSYVDFHLTETVYAGSIQSCAHAPGSAFEKVSGTRSCSTEARFAAVGVGTEVAGTAYWLPGVFPR
jgi:hypothetical protein